MAMVFTSYYNLFRFFRGRAERLDLALCPLPRVGPDVPLMLSTGIGICRRAANPALARRFIEFALSETIQRQLRAEGLAVPVRKGAARGESWSHGGIHIDGYESFESGLDRAVALGGFRREPAWRAWVEEFHLLWSGMQELEETIERATARVAERS
jgi:ABC-type glycerol-3-phosphate transport system substrate-binding protein